MIRKTLLVLALASAAPAYASVHVGGKGMDFCDASSDYSLRLAPAALTFEREGDAPRRVEIAAGTLRVDGREIAISAADRARLADFEATVREIVPEVKSVALEAVAIAFGAVEEVMRTFASADEVERIATRLATARVETVRRIEDSFEREPWSDREFEELIEQTVTELVPEVAAVAAAAAIRVAFSGDGEAAKELEQRAERMERTIEENVERRAKELERRAEALCPLVADLDRIEGQLALRIDDQPLDLIKLD